MISLSTTYTCDICGHQTAPEKVADLTVPALFNDLDKRKAPKGWITLCGQKPGINNGINNGDKDSGPKHLCNYCVNEAREKIKEVAA